MNSDATGADPVERLTVTLRVNGRNHTLDLDAHLSLLDMLREQLNLTGTKQSCDHGQCGACTVLVDGRRILSCLTLAVMYEGASITTIEGLSGEGEALHPVQRAFLEEDAYQCGYCTPGQIMAAVGLLGEGIPADKAAIREGMSGNLCRCGAYDHIVAAVGRAAGEGRS